MACIGVSPCLFQPSGQYCLYFVLLIVIALHKSVLIYMGRNHHYALDSAVYVTNANYFQKL